jgi:hypothetical protein
MGAAAAFVPLAAAVLPFAGQALGFGPKPPKAPKVDPRAQTFQAQEPPRQPTLADANVERARRAQRGPTGIRQQTVRTGPAGLLDEAPAVAGASLLA